jgi:hypothetical protein
MTTATRKPIPQIRGRLISSFDELPWFHTLPKALASELVPASELLKLRPARKTRAKEGKS